MSVTIPAVPWPTTCEPEYREFGVVKTPPGGGQELAVGELGDRWKVHFVYPPMREDCAGRFVAAQARCKTEKTTVRAALRRRGPAPTGVMGAGSINSTLVTVDSAGGVLEGMFFSFEAAGRAFLHMVTAVDGATLSVSPRLREDLSGELNFTAPVIEGLLETPVTWKIERITTSGIAFTISEDR